ncbi:fungal-specific transcription factor domain-containing protein [Xylariales sp. PMI_506]|nr:fungal-specific transcription factor domain-containing protein [Xylariales sp. PMI_506]
MVSNMDQVRPLERRKACDTCYQKKIKCDMNQPCSNCLLYRSECKTAIVRRRAAPKRGQPLSTATGSQNEPISGVESLEDRLDQIEAQLHQVVSRPLQNSPPVSTSSRDTCASTMVASSFTNGDDLQFAFGSFPVTPLPPLKEILPLVDRYFFHVNPMLPIFEKTDFYRILMEWYSPSNANNVNSARDTTKPEVRRTIFAAINVVLALSCRSAHNPPEDYDLALDDPVAEACIRNVEGIMMELVLRPQDVLTIQVLLGMMLLYLGSKDEQPATTLIGVVVHHCHQLFLGSRVENMKLLPELRRQRERLFWLTYILDKDISMRYHTPSHLADEDIDLEWPQESDVHSLEDDLFHDVLRGQVRFSWFYHRLQLASIQGQIYTQLYSARANNDQLTLEQRQARVVILDAQLENWRRNIPEFLQADSVVKTLMPPDSDDDHSGALHPVGAFDKRSGAVASMVLLHGCYVACLVRIHGIWSYEASWMRLISAFSKQAVQDCRDPGGKCGGQRPPLAKFWTRCNKAAHDYLYLFHSMPLSTSFIWLVGCPYVSSLVIVMASLFQTEDLHQFEEDQALSQQGMVTFVKLKEASNWEALHRLHNMIKELDDRATQVMISMHEATVIGTTS